MKKRIPAIPFLLVLFLCAFRIHAAPSVSEKPKRPPLPVASLALPESLGKIDSRFDAGKGRWIVYIQEVHAHRTAQENISAIIDHLNQVYGIKTVALEGGWSQTTFPQSWGLPSSREKQMLATGLLDEGMITGPALSALFSNLPIQLAGIEDPALYEKNRQLYLEHLAVKDDLQAKISALEASIEKEKAEAFNPELLSFDKSLNSFLQPSEEKSKQAEKFLPLLIQKSSELNLNVSDLDQILLLKKIMSQEKSLNKTKLQAEAGRLLKAFKSADLHFEELLRSGKVSPEKLSHYPETEKYAGLMKLQDSLDHHAFFEQVYQAIDRVKAKLLKSETEKSLDEKAGRFLISKKILLLAATPLDLDAFENNNALILAEAEKESLAEGFQIALRFYEAAKERDKVFFEKILSNPHLSGDIALVTGGFHKDGLSEFFRQNNISHIVITPDLGDNPMDEKIYQARIRDSIASQTLSDMQNRFLTADFDSAFVYGVKALKQTSDIPKAIQLVAKFLEKGNVRKALTTQAPLENKMKMVSAEDFLRFPKKKQLSLTRSWLRKAKGGVMPVVIAARTSTFQRLLKDKLGATVWEKVIAPERANTIGDLQDNEIYMTEMIGIKARIIRVKLGDGNVTKAVESKFSEAIEEKTIAVIDAGYTGKGALLLPENPVSLLLARLILEHHIVDVASPEFVSVFEELVGEILFSEKSVKRSA
jgi:hypothetical protein